MGFTSAAQTQRICQQTWRPRFSPQGQQDPPEKEMATHYSILARRTWTADPGKLRSMGSQSWTQLTTGHTQLHVVLPSNAQEFLLLHIFFLNFWVCFVVGIEWYLV